MARFETGHTKAGGRKQGTPNRRTSILAEILEDLGVSVPEQIVRLLPKLPVETRAEVLLKLMEFLYPKRKAVEREIVPGNSISEYLDRFRNMSDEEADAEIKKRLRSLNESFST